LLLACSQPEAPARPSVAPTAEASPAIASAPTAEQPPAPAGASAATPSPAPSATVPAAATAAPITPFVPSIPPVTSLVPRTARVTAVVIDPGHGGDEIGAANFGLVEKDSNLDLAFRVERLLAERGLRPVLTRRTDARAFSTLPGAAPAGFSAQRLDLQARIDMANAEGAAVFVSIHSNGSNSSAERGLEAYYNSQRPLAAENYRLATFVHDSVINELLASGYPVAARGVKDDSCLRVFQGRCFPLFVLGPERVTTRDEILRRGGNPEALLTPGTDEIRSRATQMPAALVELLFISNAQDAAILRIEPARDAMARGVALGIARYLGRE
jgi:N-acetylmuramoyl-L-alanine amidase